MVSVSRRKAGIEIMLRGTTATVRPPARQRRQARFQTAAASHSQRPAVNTRLNIISALWPLSAVKLLVLHISEIISTSNNKVKFLPARKMSWLKLNVGGEMLETTRKTLTKFPDSQLAEMVNSTKDDVLRLDLDPEYFRPVINWLR